MCEEDLSQVFAALADPTRRAILARLAGGDATVNELAEPFDMSQPSISKHLKVLERAGLISRTREAQTRPCHLEPAPLFEVANWVEAYRSLWNASFDRLDALLNTNAKAQPKKPPTSKGRKTCSKITLRSRKA
ncbi:ArsR family transcriptional regulator [Caballeronia fortuita]|uniref:ArsR family transcriptional regulator n=1 Tax=Caballeronia fortuita TaxID=1777138 RepID=A0A158ADY5_9BURK|nr:metalloregulator ArsR/SmtB family transcription factor [Caballeronia fortuita]SAK56044.1 ArsR family transcriptional regulator [Caballeronia fortuita]